MPPYTQTTTTAHSLICTQTSKAAAGTVTANLAAAAPLQQAPSGSKTQHAALAAADRWLLLSPSKDMTAPHRPQLCAPQSKHARSRRRTICSWRTRLLLQAALAATGAAAADTAQGCQALTGRFHAAAPSLATCLQPGVCVTRARSATVSASTHIPVPCPLRA